MADYDILDDIRITPACAGKRKSSQPMPLGSVDHPRMRGEKRIAVWAGWNPEGSPPHARGKEF